MGQILVYLPVDNGKVKRSSLEVLSRCKELAQAAGHGLNALVVSAGAEQAVEVVGAYGPDRIYLISSPVVAPHRNEVLLSALQAGVEACDPFLVAAASTEAVKDVLGALSVRCDASVVSDVSAFSLVDGGIDAIRPVLAAKYYAQVQARGARVLVSVRAGSYDAVERPSSPDVLPLAWNFSADAIRSTVREVLSSASDTVDLSEAEVVVGAGRGVKDEAGKTLVSELASVLNGAVGSSRAVVETGLFPPDSQIGQTGKVVSPGLYIAVGISGAIQHVAGMLNSKVIVAVNRDPEAPIFQYATYGIVGDLYTVLPLLIEEIKRVRADS